MMTIQKLEKYCLAIILFVTYCYCINIHVESTRNKYSTCRDIDVTITYPRRQIIQSLVSGCTCSIPFVASSLLYGNNICNALSPEEASLQYDTYAPTYDKLDGGIASSVLGIDEARISTISQAKGNVLEIGVGTGLNLDKYDNKLVKSLTVIDISDGMLAQASARAKELTNLDGIKLNFRIADATSELVTIYGTEAFDTIVDSFSLCVMGNDGAKRCIDQLSQLVKKGTDGQILLLENSKSSNYLLGLYQDITADVTAVAGGKGCLYNQDVEKIIKSNGQLTILDEISYSAGLFRLFKCSRI